MEFPMYQIIIVIFLVWLGRGILWWCDDIMFPRCCRHHHLQLNPASAHSSNYLLFQKAKSLKTKKEAGNTAFKAGNLDEAYKLYR